MTAQTLLAVIVFSFFVFAFRRPIAILFAIFVYAGCVGLIAALLGVRL